MGFDVEELNAFLLFQKSFDTDLMLYAEASTDFKSWGAEAGIEWRF